MLSNAFPVPLPQVTVQLLHSLLSESPGLSWAAVHRLTSRICYGGRVTDPWDLCCLEALLGRFCGPETQQEGHCYVGSSQVGVMGRGQVLVVLGKAEPETR